MGAGGSIPISPAGGKIVEPSEEEIKEMAKNIPPEMLEVLKKVVAAKEAGGGPPASSGKMWTPIKSLGNSKEATDMKRAMFMWDEETAKEALGQLFEGKKEMPQMNGATLVMEEVKWANEEEAKKFGNALKSCATAWMWEQKDADVPFDPTTSVEKKEDKEMLLKHCVYLWDEKTMDAFLEKLGVKKVGKPGKVLMDNSDRLEVLDMDDSDKVLEKLQAEGVLFFKEVVKFASKPE